MQVLVECKPFRQTVAKNLAAFRWGGGVSFLHPRSWEENPFSVEPAFPCNKSHHRFERAFPNKRSRMTFPASVHEISNTLDCSLASAKGPDVREGG